jgi:hypothetical protein
MPKGTGEIKSPQATRKSFREKLKARGDGHEDDPQTDPIRTPIHA